MKKPGVQILASVASFTMTSVCAAAEVAGAVPPEDDFAPGLFIGALFICVVLLVLIGVGIVIGIVCAACATAFVGLGIISSSAFVAILRRRFSAGFRALHYQLSAVIGWPCGISALWLGRALFEFPLRNRDLLIFGSAGGILAGICLAFGLDRLVRLAYRRLIPVSRSASPLRVRP